MELIDAHVHHWAIARGDYGWLSPALGPIYRDHGPAEFQPVRNAAKVDKVVLVQAAPTDAETQYLLELAALQPDYVLGVVGWMDFETNEAERQVSALARQPGIVGLRPMIQDIPSTEWMLGPDVAAAFAMLESEELTFDALVMPKHLGALLTLVKRYPDLRVIIDHGGKPSIGDRKLDPWRRDVAAFASFPNVACKLSGLLTQAGRGCSCDDLRPYVDHLLAVFGPRRLIWGSDWPVLNLAGEYDGWLNMCRALLEGLDADEQRDVFGGNALIAYGARQ